MKTIRELAEEIGVSKTAIRQKITPEIKLQCIEEVNGKLYIDKEGEKLIKTAFKESRFAKNLSESSSSITDNQIAEVEKRISEKLYEKLLAEAENKLAANMIATLQKELDIKNEQIANLQTSNQELTNALEGSIKAVNTAHALHAGTFHQQARLSDDIQPEIQQDKPEKTGFWAKFFNKKKKNGEEIKHD